MWDKWKMPITIGGAFLIVLGLVSQYALPGMLNTIRKAGITEGRIDELNNQVTSSIERIAKINNKISGLSAKLQRFNESGTAKAMNAISILNKNPNIQQLLAEVDSLKKRKLTCRAMPSEEYQNYRGCPKGYYSLANWCSGDCNADDAKVRICCKY